MFLQQVKCVYFDSTTPEFVPMSIGSGNSLTQIDDK